MVGSIAVMRRNRAVQMRLGDDWVAEMEWPEGHTQGGPGTLVVRPANPESYPPGGLSSTVLRGINFREATAQLRKQLTVGEHRQKSRNKREAQHLDHIRNELTKGISTEYLALLSSLYISRVNRGEPKPVEAIANDLGKGVQTIRGHLWQARTQHHLLKGSAGRKGGELTHEAIAILERIVPSPRGSMISGAET